MLGLLSSSGSWWGKPNAAWASSAPPYGVGYICGEAVRSIPHSSSLFSPIHIYPSVSSPHTRTDRSPTEQLGWGSAAGSSPAGEAAAAIFPQHSNCRVYQVTTSAGREDAPASIAAHTSAPSQAGNQRAALGSKAPKIHQDFIAFALQL